MRLLISCLAVAAAFQHGPKDKLHEHHEHEVKKSVHVKAVAEPKHKASTPVHKTEKVVPKVAKEQEVKLEKAAPKKVSFAQPLKKVEAKPKHVAAKAAPKKVQHVKKVAAPAPKKAAVKHVTPKKVQKEMKVEHIETPKLVATKTVQKVAKVDDDIELEEVNDEPQVVNGGITKPMQFEQQLLVCNAYSHTNPVKIVLNEKKNIGSEGLPYKSCRYLDAKVNTGDKIDFDLEEGIGGTFEVSALPKDDSVLLLILERRDASSSLVAFQSFAFPQNTQTTAQVALIDTFKGSPAYLNMQDRVVVDDQGQPTRSQRVRLEELDFSRVYAIEAGSYDADIMMMQNGQPTNVKKKELSLARGQDYVVFRTGTNDPNGQDLVVFPSNSASAVSIMLAFVAVVASMF